MFQNIKVDIVYHNTNTDFEMEFNLCGCCRMRLLTDKTNDTKTFVHSLARAVSRSRIIIIVGSLFGNNSIINTVSTAIGTSLEVLNNKKYSISSKDEINILKGSTPLITSDGIFGGCIIESGPQTMILLSESKSIRKTIMQTLIHPYIEELCAEELKEQASQEKSEPEITAVPMELSQVDEAVSEEVSETEEITEAEEILGEEPEIELSEGMTFEEEEEETEESVSPLILEEEIAEPKPSIEQIEPSDDTELLLNDFADEEPYEEDTFLQEPEVFTNLQYETDDEYPAKVPGKFNLPILILSAVLLIILAVLCYCIFYIPSKDGISADLYIKEIFNILFS